MAHVDCPRCNAWVELVDPEKGAYQRCAQCGNVFAVIDQPKDTVTSEVTEMAVALSAEVDQLKAELQRWQRGYVLLCEDLEPRKLAEAALMVAGVSQGAGARFLQAYDLLRLGNHPLGRTERRRGDEDDDEEPFTP